MLHCNAVAILVYIFKKQPYRASHRFLWWDKRRDSRSVSAYEDLWSTYSSPFIKLACRNISKSFNPLSNCPQSYNLCAFYGYVSFITDLRYRNTIYKHSLDIMSLKKNKIFLVLDQYLFSSFNGISISLIWKNECYLDELS